MGKWTARLAEKTTSPPLDGTDKTAKRGVLSVLAVTPEGGGSEIRTDPAPAGQPAVAPEDADLAAVTWTDADIARFTERRDRLLRWGWTEPAAEALAERLVRRDREADPRVSCIDCAHYRPDRCGNHWRAMLQRPDVSRDLAALLQRCPGQAPRSAP